MRMTVLFGSPRGAESNTRALLMPLLETWRQAGHAAEIYDLYDLKIEGCRACLGCQQDWEAPACVLDDDMQPIFDSILRSDLTPLATPIYSWYCTAPVKAALDRLVYAMDKYYGPRGKGPALLAGKPMAAVLTCATGRRRVQTSLRRGCAAGAAIPVCAGWAVWRSATWAAVPCSWTAKRRLTPEPSPRRL